jgi:hypothetical protein
MSWLIFVDDDDGPEHCFNPRVLMFVLIAGADISRSAKVDMVLLASSVSKAVAG